MVRTLVGEEGQIECKSRRQKYQIETITSGELPSEYLMQVQTGLLVSERSWCDFVSYCGGLPMFTLRIHQDPKIQAAILDAAATFEGKLKLMLDKYEERLSNPLAKLIPTERKVVSDEITL